MLVAYVGIRRLEHDGNSRYAECRCVINELVHTWVSAYLADYLFTCSRDVLSILYPKNDIKVHYSG